MQQLQEILSYIDAAIGGSQWFVYLLLGTGLFFTLYLGFPQIRFFKHAFQIVRGKFDNDDDKGDTSHFQALTTALSGTVGTGNIAGVALAIHLGGPAALFWMLVTALLGMCTKFVEVTLSHKYREFDKDGQVVGGSMLFMKKRLNINLRNGKQIKTGHWLAGMFAVATIFSSFGTGSLPQINSISNSLYSTLGVNKVLTGAILAVLLALVIIGGIKRIAKVTERLVPLMTVLYLGGAIAVLGFNYSEIIPAFTSIFSSVFTGNAATGGFLGASVIFAFNRGVNRGLFSNEAGQGSAPIAHAAARTKEPVSEGIVAILEPFIDTVIICTITGLVLLSSGVWKEKIDNKFHQADITILDGVYSESDDSDAEALYQHVNRQERLLGFTGDLLVLNGNVTSDNVTILAAQSVAEEVKVTRNDELFTGKVKVSKGTIDDSNIEFSGKSLMHSAPLTAEAFKRSYLGDWGQYIVTLGLLLFAFSTSISWSYYGDRAVSYLFNGSHLSIIIYRSFYVVGFFFAAFTDTTIVWIFSGVTIALMTLPNLIGILLLHREVKETVNDYWSRFKNKK